MKQTEEVKKLYKQIEQLGSQLSKQEGENKILKKEIADMRASVRWNLFPELASALNSLIEADFPVEDKVWETAKSILKKAKGE